MRTLLAFFIGSVFVGAVAISAGGCGSNNSTSAGDSGTDSNKTEAGSGNEAGDGNGGGDGNTGEGGTDGGCVSFPEFVLNQIKTTSANSKPVAIPPVCATADGSALIPSSSF